MRVRGGGVGREGASPGRAACCSAAAEQQPGASEQQGPAGRQAGGPAGKQRVRGGLSLEGRAGRSVQTSVTARGPPLARTQYSCVSPGGVAGRGEGRGEARVEGGSPGKQAGCQRVALELWDPSSAVHPAPRRAPISIGTRSATRSCGELGTLARRSELPAGQGGRGAGGVQGG